MTKDTIEDILERGRGIIGVKDPNPTESRVPTFFYSIGNSYYGETPLEFICFWHTPTGAKAINYVAELLLKNPVYLRSVLDNEVTITGTQDLFDSGVDVALRPLTGVLEDIVRDRFVCQLDRDEYSPYVRPHHLIQVVLPDLSNKFPGDPKHHADRDCLLPEYLYLPNPEKWTTLDRDD